MGERYRGNRRRGAEKREAGERGWEKGTGEGRTWRNTSSGDDARKPARTLFHFWLCKSYDPKPGLVDVRKRKESMPSSLLIHGPLNR